MIEMITSRQNPLLVHVKKLFSSRAYRQAYGEFAADGFKLFEEAAASDFPITAVILSEGVQCPEAAKNVRTVCVPADVMHSISPMEAPQGILFTCKIPQTAALAVDPGTMILDELQDPGNLGTILRTADAMEIPLILTTGCADLWNPKTVRASMGAVFRRTVPIARKEEIISLAAENDVPLLAAALSPRAQDIRSADLNGAIIIGNEGNGVSEELLRASAREIIIPMNQRCESLNAAAAAAILLWELRRGR